MEVDPNDPAATVEHEGQTYYFCSDGCAERFEANMDEFMRKTFPFLNELSGHVVPRMTYGRRRGEFDLQIAGEEIAVGDSVSYEKRLSKSDVEGFADVTGDTNALHLNESFARRTRFSGRIVHGTLVAGLISAALAAFPGLTIYIEQDLSFRRPARIGASLTAKCAVAEALDDDMFRLVTTVTNEDEQIVIDGTATVLIDDLPLST